MIRRRMHNPFLVIRTTRTRQASTQRNAVRFFVGTLSSPDSPNFSTGYVVRPESYQLPRALLERGKGTRAAIKAMKRALSGKTLTPADERRKANPLLHSAEAEIARARQVAAFLGSAKRHSPLRSALSYQHVHFAKPSPFVSPLQTPEQQGKGQESGDGLKSTPGINLTGLVRDIEVTVPADNLAAQSGSQPTLGGTLRSGSEPMSDSVEDTTSDPAAIEGEKEQENRVSAVYLNVRSRLMVITDSLPSSSPPSQPKRTQARERRSHHWCPSFRALLFMP